MKYLVFNNGKFEEFNSGNDAEYFMLDKPNAMCRKITSQKIEDDFRQTCLGFKEFKQKIYVVIADNKVKRFEKGKEAKEFIDRNPGCKYKSFESEAEAQEFSNKNVHAVTESEDSLIGRTEKNGEIGLYKNGLLVEKTVIKNINNGIELELQGTLAAIRKAISMGEEHIIIEFSNLGTEMGANGTWVCNKEYSVAYKKEIDELMKRINIDFKQIS